MLSSILYLVMDAPDVAMTEAALGVCITTIIFLKVDKLCASEITTPSKGIKTIGFLSAALLASVLVYACADIPHYGTKNSIHLGVQEYYNTHTYKDMGIPSFVTAILASYRGYDTLGETFVIFLAGLSVTLILVTINKRDN